MKVVIEGDKFKTPTRQKLFPTHHHFQIYGYSKAIGKRNMSREHKKSLFQLWRFIMIIHLLSNVPLLTWNQEPSNCIITSKASLRRWKILQEHKLKGNQANKVGELLWKEATCWISQVEEGFFFLITRRENMERWNFYTNNSQLGYISYKVWYLLGDFSTMDIVQ